MRRFSAVVLAVMLLSAPASGDIAIAELSVVPQESKVVITGSVLGLSEGVVEAEMIVSKGDASGTANLRQSGEFQVRSGSIDTVGSSGINLNDTTTLKVVLILRSEGLEIARATSDIEPGKH
ncbi:curli-like amyloid fiber formation chaperone CsgH [Falsihalocynthiibacter sp. BN13B15]|uniref:curli-like amyloid fiber formation chaperone CsgH n=1 Tax=Falsihalocynthiibacter sp. BN13B15 TaxID=3240871 RepID=UPI00350FAEF5